MLATPLREIKGIADMILYGLGEPAQIPAARSHPDHWFERWSITHHLPNIVILLYRVKCPEAPHAIGGMRVARACAFCALALYSR